MELSNIRRFMRGERCMPERDRILAVVAEWVEKAEHDLTAASHTLKLGKQCPTDTVCFHAQQCVEKYFKAVLALDQPTILRRSHRSSPLSFAFLFPVTKWISSRSTPHRPATPDGGKSLWLKPAALSPWRVASAARSGAFSPKKR